MAPQPQSSLEWQEKGAEREFREKVTQEPPLPRHHHLVSHQKKKKEKKSEINK
jgi:hypothetical protein